MSSLASLPLSSEEAILRVYPVKLLVVTLKMAVSLAVDEAKVPAALFGVRLRLAISLLLLIVREVVASTLVPVAAEACSSLPTIGKQQEKQKPKEGPQKYKLRS